MESFKMQMITDELKQNPRHLIIDLDNNTWWEIGTDGESYQTDAPVELYMRIRDKPKGRHTAIWESVRYEYEIQ